MAQVSTPAVEINSDWRSILLKAVTDALAKQIPLLIEKYADPGLKFLIGYLAQTKSSRQNVHPYYPIGRYDASNSNTHNSTAVA
ncbi:hypothetical protein MJO28_013624 [Puccinia striiformis f. sp. tritici]|uniref:Uncharacterized protein n=2 Tax=Puccinia striiformis f. sp. tritici TaxID=168172 RepID=A0A0L0V9X7_9BASI|nr:hypothetical protein MJO28_013624 [Puccinia striiformis f. sp. tritici]KAI7941407.1 hypothetical protein MJO29_013481 [Puccinia striiformis f. sp. tritici]KAI9629080.1 hypothetical protein KEM48_011150 [Puccinia striiformis f. sp. tritici PST-130]KNE96092.1 hypothetical protein PSTG_10664 [Puccinia striiformis f. sp. tritici PST-78]